jgi:CRP-like cAMP-binding protein
VSPQDRGSRDPNKVVSLSERSGASTPTRSAPADNPHRANRLLAALKLGDFEVLKPHLQLVELRHAEVLYEPGDTIQHAYFPHQSMVCLVAVLEEGALAEVALFGREGVMGFASSLVTSTAFGRYMVQVPGTASRIEAGRLREATDARPDIRNLFLRYTEALLAQTFQTVACNAVHPVEARCCRWILATLDRAERDDLPLTHEFLGEMLGVQRPTVSLIARSLQNAGLIRQGRGVITVVDRPGLEETACGCYGAIRRSFERFLPGTYGTAS